MVACYVVVVHGVVYDDIACLVTGGIGIADGAVGVRVVVGCGVMHVMCFVAICSDIVVVDIVVVATLVVSIVVTTMHVHIVCGVDMFHCYVVGT